MGRFNSILSVFIIYILAVSFLTFTTYREEAIREAKEYDLDISVNYAVDAAVEEMLVNSEDLKLDYADYEFVAVDPQIALDTYCEVLLENLGYPVTEENIQMIKTANTPCFIVACYEGYYVATPTIIENTGNAVTYDLLFSEKKPYFYQDPADTNKIWSLNLGMIDAKYVDLTTGSVVKTRMPVSEAEARKIINTQISKDFLANVYKYNNAQLDLKHEIFIPDVTTVASRTNSVIAPSVLAYVNNIYIGSGEPLESFAIGGARLDHTDYVGTYIRNGIPSYCPVEFKPDNIEFTHIYERAEYAAQHGYFADITNYHY